MGSPAERPPSCCLSPTFRVVVPRHLARLVLWTRSVMTRSTYLVYMSRPSGARLLMLRLPRFQTVMMTSPFRAFHSFCSGFVWKATMRGFSFRALCILLPLPCRFPQFALSLPCRLVAVADDDLLGIVNIYFLLLSLATNSMIDLDKVINSGSLQMSSWKLQQHRNCNSKPQRNHYRLHLI
jgi:hypothetical protein